MKELFQGKLEIVQLFKKYFTEIRKKEVENSTELLKELDRKTKVLNSKLKIENNEKDKIYRKLEKIQDLEIELERVKEIVNVQDKAIEDISAMTASFAENIGIDEKTGEGIK